MSKTAHIYAITLKETGDSYVGITVRLLGRWHWHLHNLRSGSHPCGILQREWASRGHAAFAWRVLGAVHGVAPHDKPVEELHWIRRIGSMNADDPIGDIRADFDAEAARLSDSFSADPLISEILRRHARRVASAGLSAEAREERRLKHIERMKDPMMRASQSRKLAAYWQKPENKARKSRLMKKAFRAPARRAQMSAQMKAFWADPVRSAALRSKRASRWADPKARARQARKIKASWKKRKDQSPKD